MSEVYFSDEPIVGVPFVDEYGMVRDGLTYYEGGNGCKIYCPDDNHYYDNAVVPFDSNARFFQTEIPIVYADDEDSEE